MLSLIPALLLLAFHGPSAVERFGHEGRLPAALRALERAWTPESAITDSEEEDSQVGQRREAFKRLAALTSDPLFSKLVADLVGLELPVGEASSESPDSTEEAHAPQPVPQGLSPAVQDGFAACRRTRDGPTA